MQEKFFIVVLGWLHFLAGPGCFCLLCFDCFWLVCVDSGCFWLFLPGFGCFSLLLPAFANLGLSDLSLLWPAFGCFPFVFGCFWLLLAPSCLFLAACGWFLLVLLLVWFFGGTLMVSKIMGGKFSVHTATNLPWAPAYNFFRIDFHRIIFFLFSPNGFIFWKKVLLWLQDKMFKIFRNNGIKFFVEGFSQIVSLPKKSHSFYDKMDWNQCRWFTLLHNSRLLHYWAFQILHKKEKLYALGWFNNHFWWCIRRCRALNFFSGQMCRLISLAECLLQTECTSTQWQGKSWSKISG